MDLFDYLVFHGNTMALENAVNKGQVERYTDNRGLTFCKHAEHRRGTTWSNKEKTAVTGFNDGVFLDVNIHLVNIQSFDNEIWSLYNAGINQFT